MHIDFDPAIFSLGGLQVRWYGLMYVIGFVIGGKQIAHLCKTKFIPMDPEKTDNFITYLLIGMVVFARLFYVFIYNWEETHSLVDVIAVWRGGLSFHGAAFGFIVMVGLFSKKYKVAFWGLIDAIGLAAPQGLFFGRIGNFINMELYGRATDVPWAMTFASDPNFLARHPSQLYEAIGEGLIVGLILWFVVKPRAKVRGLCGAGFLIGYGIVRYIVEFFREADVQMGYYFGETTTMGQILCVLMVIAGIWMWRHCLKRNELISESK